MVDLNVDGHIDRVRGRDYIPGTLLIHAVNTALALGRPLLVSGEPGCGKTELGFAIARRLKIPQLRFFAVKSDSEAQSLFYEYDAVHRLHTAQIVTSLLARSDDDKERMLRPHNFIRYRALGKAILDAIPRAAVAQLTSDDHEWPDAPVQSVVIPVPFIPAQSCAI